MLSHFKTHKTALLGGLVAGSVISSHALADQTSLTQSPPATLQPKLFVSDDVCRQLDEDMDTLVLVSSEEPPEVYIIREAERPMRNAESVVLGDNPAIQDQLHQAEKHAAVIFIDNLRELKFLREQANRTDISDEDREDIQKRLVETVQNGYPGENLQRETLRLEENAIHEAVRLAIAEHCPVQIERAKTWAPSVVVRSPIPIGPPASEAPQP
jgi:hypothetical protein